MFYRKQSLGAPAPLHHPKNDFEYDQMTSNPAFTERNTQKANAYLLHLFLSGENIFGRVSHSTELVRMCLACRHFDFNSADWISANLHVMSS